MNAILVDDEPHALDYLERHLAKISNIEVVGKYIDPFVGKEKTIEKAVDVVFLDINLPKMNGLQLAEQILARKPDVTVVFVTACDEYAVHAFEVNALDYLVKPVRSDRLRKTIARIEEHLRTKKNRQRPQDEPIRVNVCRQLTVQAENELAEMIRWRTARAQELFPPSDCITKWYKQWKKR
ncbi:LytR/AlgR family response regulator transcription factor [Numidum massiliense]|uniref:LytR/AlgR family response regulator transcription factor n=1 Tax=Numidum massiliense TaxID=1522315 RepID=UPI0006D5473F|nr:response regulator [Numidum massiliense]